MNHAKPLAGLILSGLLAAGCSGNGTKAAGPEDYNKALADANTAISNAKKVGYEWRDTGKILKQADEAAKAGKFDDAVKLADKARRQGDLAVAQYHNQQNAGPRL